MFGQLLSLVKPRIVALLSVTGLCGLFAAGGGRPLQVAGFLAAGALVAGGAAALNCWYDRDIDRHMERTADRPLPSGDLSSRAALLFAVGLLAAGTAVGVVTLPLASVGYMWAGVAAYVGLYTVLLKRRTRLGVVLGGSAGSFPVLAGWVAVRPLDPVALAAAALVFVWTPAHAWALAVVYRDDFRAVGVPTLPAVTPPDRTARVVWYAAVATVASAAALVPVTGSVYAVGAAVGSPLFLLAYWQYRRQATEATAVRAFFTSNCYLAVLFPAWAVDGLLAAPARGTLAVTAVLAFAAFAWLWARRPSLRGVRAAPSSLVDGVVSAGRAAHAGTVGRVSGGAARVRERIRGETR
ncbi:heme o synthase [Halorarius halobius]|uniref:heme o synthase n=1 Tax=Halorarius halobius TaxID=2962671 RepID=UPI0020CE77B0|nr:heme o synthase [Halorarius halobius]